jgi:hypothetical protein
MKHKCLFAKFEVLDGDHALIGLRILWVQYKILFSISLVNRYLDFLKVFMLAQTFDFPVNTVISNDSLGEGVVLFVEFIHSEFQLFHVWEALRYFREEVRVLICCHNEHAEPEDLNRWHEEPAQVLENLVQIHRFKEDELVEMLKRAEWLVWYSQELVEHQVFKEQVERCNLLYFTARLNHFNRTRVLCLACRCTPCTSDVHHHVKKCFESLLGFLFLHIFNHGFHEKLNLSSVLANQYFGYCVQNKSYFLNGRVFHPQKFKLNSQGFVAVFGFFWDSQFQNHVHHLHRQQTLQLFELQRYHL